MACARTAAAVPAIICCAGADAMPILTGPVKQGLISVKTGLTKDGSGFKEALSRAQAEAKVCPCACAETCVGVYKRANRHVQTGVCMNVFVVDVCANQRFSALAKVRSHNCRAAAHSYAYGVMTPAHCSCQEDTRPLWPCLCSKRIHFVAECRCISHAPCTVAETMALQRRRHAHIFQGTCACL